MNSLNFGNFSSTCRCKIHVLVTMVLILLKKDVMSLDSFLQELAIVEPSCKVFKGAIANNYNLYCY